jgi:hypothetical protein
VGECQRFFLRDLDFHESHLETGVPRHLKTEAVPGKATECMGVRRCGKSTYLLQVTQRLTRGPLPSTRDPAPELGYQARVSDVLRRASPKLLVEIAASVEIVCGGGPAPLP